MTKEKLTKIVDGETIELTEVEIAEFYKQPPIEEKKAKLKNQLIFARFSYLRNTDWYVVREVDEPSSYPIEIKNKRILAREEINKINLSKSLEDLNQFVLDFN